MAWDATVKGSEFNVSQSKDDRTGARAGTRDIGSGISAGGLLDAIMNGGLVGINANKIPDIQTEIRTQINSINSYLEGINPTANSDKAFKSEEIKASVNAYMLKVQEYAQALISDLLAFNDKLEQVKEAWQESTKTFATSEVDESASANFSGVTDRYQEQFTGQK